MLQNIFIATVLVSLCVPVSLADEAWSCPDVEVARQAFLSGKMAEWPNYSESHGARVQRQYPETAFIGAQAKFIDWGDETVATCQYYSHIGLVATMVAVGLTKASSSETCESECGEDAYWRHEFTESTPDLDQPGREQLEVCMQDHDGLSYPSVGCAFLIPE